MGLGPPADVAAASGPPADDDAEDEPARAPRRLAFAAAALVVAVGAAYPLAVARALGGAASLEAVGRGAWASAPPGLALVVVARLARGHRRAAWTAVVGGLLTLALGVALYAAALSSPLSYAPAVAVRLVPLRQLAACAFAGWAVWLARRAR